MPRSSALALALLLSAVLLVAGAHPVPAADHDHDHNHARCATEEIDEVDAFTIQGIAERTRRRLCTAVPSLRICEALKTGTVNEYVIDTAFHVIYDPATGNGNVTDAVIEEQMAVLNEDYAGQRSPGGADTGLRFRLVHVSRTGNAQWFNNFQMNERNIKSELAYEPLTTIQIYTGQFRAGLLGFCPFPSSYPEDSVMHGCFNLWSSLPGNPGPYGSGRTVTHEVGHGTGLYHTFQGGCYGAGDQVEDTPPQAQSTSGCPDPAPISCPNSNFPDDIHNYMDYSYDDCMHRFSEGQSVRVHEQLLAFRPSLLLSAQEMESVRRFAPAAFDEARSFQKIRALRSERQ